MLKLYLTDTSKCFNVFFSYNWRSGNFSNCRIFNELKNNKIDKL